MIENIAFPSDDIAGFRITGRITSQAYDAIREVVDRKLAQHDKLRFYVEIPVFEGLSAEAFFRDIKFTVKNWSRFEREAVVSDATWLQNVTSVAGKLMPGIDVRAFPMAEADAAKEWISR